MRMLFTFKGDTRYKHTICSYDEERNMLREFEYPAIDFSNKVCVQVRSKLYALSEGKPINVFKYIGIGEKKIVTRQLKSLSLIEQLHGFAVTNWHNDCIVLSGGHSNDFYGKFSNLILKIFPNIYRVIIHLPCFISPNV